MLEEFKKLRNRLVKEGYVFPSVRAFRELAGEECEVEEVYRDNSYVQYRLRYREYVMEYVDCYTSDVHSNITLYHGDEVVFYSPSE